MQGGFAPDESVGSESLSDTGIARSGAEHSVLEESEFIPGARIIVRTGSISSTCCESTTFRNDAKAVA